MHWRKYIVFVLFVFISRHLYLCFSFFFIFSFILFFLSVREKNVSFRFRLFVSVFHSYKKKKCIYQSKWNILCQLHHCCYCYLFYYLSGSCCGSGCSSSFLSRLFSHSYVAIRGNTCWINSNVHMRDNSISQTSHIYLFFSTVVHRTHTLTQAESCFCCKSLCLFTIFIFCSPCTNLSSDNDINGLRYESKSIRTRKDFWRGFLLVSS